jgi:FkbM family methyltransferase
MFPAQRIDRVEKQPMSNTVTPESVEELYAQGRLAEAAQVLAEAITKQETSTLWNDWGVVHVALAQRAFRRALELEPTNDVAAANLGVLLFSEGKSAEAVPLLKQALGHSEGGQRAHIVALLAQCEASLSSASGPATDMALVKKEIRGVLEEYFAKGNRSIRAATPEGFAPILDGKPEWIEQILGQRAVHDADYLVFGAFQDPESIILDIGGNSGYSAASIWASGSQAKVVTFEPNAGFGPCLKRVAELRPGGYEYLLIGLADVPGSLEFAMPVINGYAIGALTTACRAPNLDCLADSIVEHYEKHMAAPALQWFRMHRFQAEVARLDDLLAEGRISGKTEQIVALKIDSEGYEGPVVAGSCNFLAAQKTLVLVEGGHTNPLVFEPLLKLGYVHAQRREGQLRPVDAPVQSVNGFFIHPARFEEYKRIGLLVE